VSNKQQELRKLKDRGKSPWLAEEVLDLQKARVAALLLNAKEMREKREGAIGKKKSL